MSSIAQRRPPGPGAADYGQEPRPLDAWLRRDLAGRYDGLLTADLPAELLAILDEADASCVRTGRRSCHPG